MDREDLEDLLEQMLCARSPNETASAIYAARAWLADHHEDGGSCQPWKVSSRSSASLWASSCDSPIESPRKDEDMDDLLMIRFALDNVHPVEIAQGARQALDRLLDGEAVADLDSGDGRRYERLRRGRRLHLVPGEQPILHGIPSDGPGRAQRG